MDIELIDLNKIEECGKEILNEELVLSDLFENNYTVVNNMTTKTFEWVGDRANAFVDKYNNDNKSVNDLSEFMFKYGNFLLDSCTSIRNIIDDNVLYFKYNELENKVIPMINVIIDRFSAIKLIVDNILIPEEFDYKSYLLGLSDVFNNIVKHLKNIIDELYSFNKALINCFDEIKQMLLDIN